MVGIAVCGAGNWGRNLVRNFAAAPGAQLRYICDLNEALRRKIAPQYPAAKTVADLRQALDDPQVHAVVVAVDVPVHHKIARMALEAGKHTYVEKPLTLTSREAQDLVSLAESKGLKLMVGHLLLYHPCVNYLKRMIDGGELDPLYLYFQRVNLGIVRQKENAWWSLAPHDVSVACYLLGSEPVSVSVTGRCFLQPGVEDVAFASVKFADGRMAHIHVSWLDPHKIRKMTVVGKTKMVVFDDMEAAEKIRIYDKSAEVKEGVESYAEAITLRNGDIVIPAVATDEPLAAECRHFLDCIVHDRQPLSDGVNGLRVVRVLEAGSASLAQGGTPVAIDLPTPAASARA
ncbi:MAG: Gfo/Idh/MocA family oxidoreductase [Phycisphaeraceae bacterium]